ncbi:MAG: hypothetical protein JRG91_20560, partial [Deltaproteobacteria bacterium]|nr:hypothetical protein [Deltaproteobacteria bacterium]
VVLIVYKYTSNQKAMLRVKNRLKASFLAFSLYKDSLRVILMSSLRITRDNFHYMALNIVPLLVMIGPVLVVMVQLDGWFGHRPLRPGEEALVKAQVDGEMIMGEGLSLDVPGGLTINAPPVRMADEDEICWRIKAIEEGDHLITLRLGETSVDKTVPVGTDTRRVSLERHDGGFWDGFFHPAEKKITAAGVHAISVSFASSEMSVFGWRVHWIWVFLALTMVFAFALRDLFKVTF